jgi:hypothetical protein
MDGLDGCVRTRNNHLGNRPAVGGRKDAIGLGGGWFDCFACGCEAGVIFSYVVGRGFRWDIVGVWCGS